MKDRKNSYQLINPVITGNMSTVVKSRNSFNASKKIYKSLSKYANNHVDNFYMTIQNLVSKELSHFSVKENRTSDSVKYSISRLPGNFKKELEDKLIELTTECTDSEQCGGVVPISINIDSADDTSSDSELSYVRSFIPIYPVSAMIYYYMPYYQLHSYGISQYDLDRICVPMFSFPNNPTVEFRFDLYFRN